MIFLTESDFKGVLGTSVLTGLKGTNSDNLTEAEKLAVSELSPLRGKYEVDTELAKVDDDRNKELVRILVNITAYYLYNVVPDTEIPQRITSNFDKEIKGILAISSGKQYSTLLGITDSITGSPRTKFRAGSDKARSNDPFYM